MKVSLIIFALTVSNIIDSKNITETFRGGSKWYLHFIISCRVTLQQFRGIFPVLNCSVSKLGMLNWRHYCPIWHMFCKFWMYVKRRILNSKLCRWFWSLLCGAGVNMWVIHLCKYILHPESRISQHIHPCQWGNMCLHHQQSQWRCNTILYILELHYNILRRFVNWGLIS